MQCEAGSAGSSVLPGLAACGFSTTSKRSAATSSVVARRSACGTHLSSAGARFGGERPLRRADMARDTNFYYSFLVLPPDKRRAIVAVWDFCRAVDDAVDEAPPERSANEIGRAS